MVGAWRAGGGGGFEGVGERETRFFSAWEAVEEEAVARAAFALQSSRAGLFCAAV